MTAEQRWQETAQKISDLTLGRPSRVDLVRLAHGTIARALVTDDGITDIVVRLSYTDSQQEVDVAYTHLIERLTREDGRLTTQEAAEVLGMSGNGVRDALRRGKLPCAEAGGFNTPARFWPADVWAYLEYRAEKLKVLAETGVGEADSD